MYFIFAIILQNIAFLPLACNSIADIQLAQVSGIEWKINILQPA
jgi:hypothetical protein